MAQTDQRDPFANLRRETGVAVARYGEERIPMLLRHRDVKAAAADWRTFSSDAPFRIPIPGEQDVRSVRQLPIEIDPPAHGDYKKILLRVFRRPHEPGFAAAMEALVDALLDTAPRGQPVDMLSDFIRPLQARALAALLNLPEQDADLFVGWGNNVFRDSRGQPDLDKVGALDRYLTSRLDRAAARPGDDLFGDLTRARILERPLSREEMLGMANLVFAAGRDTVIHLIAEVLVRLAEQPSDFAACKADPSLVVSATEEFVRYFSPLTHIGRVVTRDLDIAGEPVRAGGRASLCWASANHDETVFDAPHELRLGRHPNPHVGFGAATHRCLGALHARVVLRTVLKRLAVRVAALRVVAAEPGLEIHGNIRRRVGYRTLVMTLDGDK